MKEVGFRVEGSDEEFVFWDLRPNLVEPITEGTFQELDGLLAEINASVGVVTEANHQGDTYAANREVSFSRYETSDGLRIITVNGKFPDTPDARVGIMLRTDAGSLSNRRQIAANKTVWVKDAEREIIPDLSDGYIRYVSQFIAESRQRHPFKRKEYRHRLFLAA